MKSVGFWRFDAFKFVVFNNNNNNNNNDNNIFENLYIIYIFEVRIKHFTTLRIIQIITIQSLCQSRVSKS